MTISRRQFLRQSALAVAGVGLAQTAAAKVITGPAKKVLILGAGMAGLVAGYELTKLGHDVTILEARMRPGGRVHTLREPFDDGLFAEEGASRIPDEHDLTHKYVKVFNLPLEPFYPSALKAVRFDRGGREEVPIDGYTDAMTHMYSEELGGDPKRWQKITGGMEVLPKAFAKGLAEKIHYGAVVVKLDQDEKQATVKFDQKGATQTLSADIVLCTIPFSVLRKIDLPGLSSRSRDVIKRALYGGVSRVYLQTKSRFWEKNGLNGFAVTRNPIEIWQPTWNQPGPRGILMTYARPGEAERVSSLKEPERIKFALDQLDPIFTGLRENFEHGASKCWIEDEWSRGAWGFVGPVEAATLGHDGRIYFAGEHLSPWSSWIQGALWSGLKAVKEIDEAAGKTVL